MICKDKKVLDICTRLGANDYYNAIGGKELYDADSFQSRGIRLHFLKTEYVEYEQVNSGFVSNLSIIDVMMCNGKESIKLLLRKYTMQ